MSFFTLVLKSLFQHRRLNLAVALGVATATAVLTGALVVGDSMRGSLRAMVVERLGRIDQALVADRFFREQLADDLARKANLADEQATALPLMLLSGSMEHADNHRRAGRVNVLGTDERFWQLGDDTADASGNATKATGIRPKVMPGEREVALNAALAAELGIGEADLASRPEVLLRLPRMQAVSADSPLGRKTETVDTVRLTVVAIVPGEGLGRFDLSASQQEPRTAWVSLASLQSELKRTGHANAIFIAARDRESSVRFPADVLRRVLSAHDDLGLTVKRVKVGAAHEHDDLSSDRMMMPAAVEKAALATWEKRAPQPVLAYLANWISATRDGKRAAIPYSVVAAVDSMPDLGPLTIDTADKPIGKLADDEVVLNRWAFDDLKAQGIELKPGDAVTLEYFEPESTHGEVRERSATFRLKAVAPLAEPNQPPLLTNDPTLTPEVPGVTDKDSIRNWNAPFPYDSRRVRPQDDAYWRKFKTTPKAFVSLAAGRKLWASRFGQTTSIRAAVDPAVKDEGAAIVASIDPAEAGFAFRPLKQTGLAAAEGTTSFAGLFLGFSMFLIASALMLVVLLFRLGVEQRASEIGLLLAVGWTPRRTRWWMLAQGVAVAAAGGLIGVAAGVGFAALMLFALKTVWVGAISAPFLNLHYEKTTLIAGYASGVVASTLAIAWALRQFRRASVRGLLSGRIDVVRAAGKRRSWTGIVVVAMLAAAVALGAMASRMEGEAQAGAFFGSGALVLAALLVWVRHRLGAPSSRSLVTSGGGIVRLALRNTARSIGRSTLTIGLVAAASFLIVAISAFRLDPTPQGAGGFALYAECAQSLYYSPTTAEGQAKLGINDEQAAALAGAKSFAIRVSQGDDASCLNLYRPQRPRVLGVGAAFIERGGFQWSKTAAETEEERSNPWRLLEGTPDPDNPEVIPVALDDSTATYSLKLGLGDQYALDDGRGGRVVCQVVALLKNSILQGDVIMSERRFTRAFPEVSGYRLLLVETPEKSAAADSKIAQTLEDALGDFGLDAQRCDERLAGFMAVQNTYLSTFQSLGGLGLLLGTLGLAAVQLRNVFERRGELALLQAIGFRRQKLARMVLAENAALLAGGLACGVTAAMVAIMPHLVAGGAGVPWRTLLVMLAAILAAGMAAGWSAVRATMNTPVLSALRGD